MSVLVRDMEDNKLYCFLKGAPEKIDRVGINRIEKYNKYVEDLCLGGYRTIGYSFKEIKPE